MFSSSMLLSTYGAAIKFNLQSVLHFPRGLFLFYFLRHFLRCEAACVGAVSFCLFPPAFGPVLVSVACQP
jgi:hypothetical protein